MLIILHIGSTGSSTRVISSVRLPALSIFRVHLCGIESDRDGRSAGYSLSSMIVKLSSKFSEI